MKKLLLLFMLLPVACCYAQSISGYGEAHTETSFAIAQEDIYHTHVVNLQNKQQMIIELTDVTDYILLKNFDSVLRVALNDVAFYKDSVSALEHVRVDYDIKLGSDDILMRFSRHQPVADVYVKRNGNIAAMKIDRDTFRIIIRKPLLDRHGPAFFYNYPIQVTFVTNNYPELYNVIADKDVIMQSIDTLMKTMIPKQYCPQVALHQSYAQYNPYSYNKALYKRNIDLEHKFMPGLSKKAIARMEAKYGVHLK